MSHTVSARVLGQAGRSGRSSSVVATAALAAAALAGLRATTAGAAQHVYTPAGTTSDQWSAGTNWSSTPVSGAATQLTFVGNNATVIPDGQTSVTNNDIAGNFLLNILDLQGTGPAATDSIITITGNTLELVNNGGTLPVVNLNANDAAQDLDYLVSNNLTLTGNTTFTGNGTAAFTFGGAIGGGGSLTKTGTSSLFLSGVNTYAGGTTVGGGTLRTAQAASLPGYNAPGQVVVNNGATLAANAGSGGQWTDVELDTLRASATFNAGSALGVNVDSAVTFTYGSNIGGALGVSKSGAGTLVLAGTNTYAGNTTVTGGTLQSNAAVNLPGYNSPGRVAVTGGSLRLTAGTGAWTSAELDGLATNATFGAGSNVTLDVSDAATISVNLTQPHSLTKTGGGTLTLTGTNTYSGTTSLAGGTLAVTNGAQLGSGTLNLGNSTTPVTLQTTATTATITNPTVLIDGNGTGPLTLNAAGDVEFTGNLKTTEANAVWTFNSPGTLTLSGPIHTTDNAAHRNLRIGGTGNVLISGVISNGTAGATTGGIGYTGSGKMTLTGNNTFAGTTFVTSGIVSISSGANLGASRVQFGEAATVAPTTLEVTGTGPLTIPNGILIRSGTAGPGVLAAARPIDFSGTMSATTGTAILNINNSSLTTFSGNVALSDGGSNRTIRLGGTGDVAVTGQVTNSIPGGGGIGSFGQFGTGTITLSNATNNYTGTTTIASGTLAVGANTALGTSTLAFGNNSAVATLRADGGPRTIANTVNLSSSQPNPSTIGGSQDLTLSGAVSNANSHGYLAITNTANTTLSGQVFLSNNVANARTLHIAGPGNLLISGVVANANGAGLASALEHNGIGTVTLSNANTHTGGTAVVSGTLVAAHADAINTGQSLSVSNGAIAREQTGVLTALDVGTLTIGATGKLDLNDGGLVKRNAGAGQAATLAITAQLKTGLENGGNFDWLGVGISSTEANADNNTAGSVLFGIGVVQNNLNAAGTPNGTTADATPGGEIYTTFKGRPAALNDTLVRYTYMGDADLDGAVTGTDYSLIDAGFGAGLSGWLNGDFDYSGSIDGTDYALIDNAFGAQTGVLPEQYEAMVAEHAALFGQSYVDALAAVQSGVVPEPAAFGVLALAGAGLLARRRRRA